MFTINTFKTNGTDAVPVIVECDIKPGVGIHLVGLADISVKESLLRTITAMESRGYHYPGKRVVINLAPADLRKGGSHYDLPIALSIIGESGQDALVDADKYIIAGELGLDGRLRDIPGWAQAAELAKELGKSVILPVESARLAASAVKGASVVEAATLQEVIDIVSGRLPGYVDSSKVSYPANEPVWDSIVGQEAEKRALEIAAAGGHPILMVGVPGSGRTMLARALNEILPPMSEEEALEVQRVYSVCGQRIAPGLRPFREVLCTTSIPALLGGGSGDTVLPGSVSLAHNGVLFLDEIGQMPKSVIEALRGPIEDRSVCISRLKAKVEFPASFMLVAASNPCPCGYYGEGDRCTCTPTQRQVYHARLGGPVYDMTTMQVWTRPNQPGATLGEPSHIVAERVRKARERQIERQGKLNDELNATEAEEACGISGEYGGEDIFNAVKELISKLNLSCRAYSRTLKIARTIADLDGVDEILPHHVAEASAYRFLDRLSF